MTEIWKPVVGYENIYEVSSLGRIRSMDRLTPYKDGIKRWRKGKIKKTMIRRDGYEITGLSQDGVQKTAFVHRLVAEAFIGVANHKAEVNHIDGVKSNNFVENLEYVTRAENVDHAIKTGLSHVSYPTQRNKNKLWASKYKGVQQFDANGKLVAMYASVREASKRMNVSESALRRAARGVQIHCRGFTWKYIHQACQTDCVA